MKLNVRLGAIALACVSLAAMAQPVYRQVDGNGRVTYSDQPPTSSAKPAPRAGTVTALPTDTALPYELRQVVQRYPVTLYSRDACEPCESAKTLLTTRGVPFTEKTIQTPQDSDALQRLTGQISLPVVTIGAQQLKGFSDGEWTQFLDAAGYPPSSRLPAGYRMPPATPMVATQVAPAQQPAAPSVATPPPATAAPSGPTAENPAGIKF
ncbi:glutaredoxin family protein [Variovorax sp. J22R133]|uniref:glutaredoxin family protein n=1 Tax=Variovorax brevis TaxID=3053503 RepID=UPI00257823D7|nr:glutaredoxin family protein [Variovorax sp. J22R133]MDM0112143.1 glutaredoxin family protein [Variovorax sp. J22R133]